MLQCSGSSWCRVKLLGHLPHKRFLTKKTGTLQHTLSTIKTQSITSNFKLIIAFQQNINPWFYIAQTIAAEELLYASAGILRFFK